MQVMRKPMPDYIDQWRSELDKRAVNSGYPLLLSMAILENPVRENPMLSGVVLQQVLEAKGITRVNPNIFNG